MARKKSHNEAILNYLIRQARRSSVSANANYLILYAFLYKYLSDKLKNHLLHQFGADGDDLKIFYLTDEGKAEIREVALNDLGYFIESYDAYIDHFTGDKFVEEFIHPEFLSALKKSIEFSKDNPCRQYFNFITETLERYTSLYGYDAEQELFISNYLLSISKLDIEEEEFSFRRVYDLISSSRQIRLTPTPEYITQILEETVTSKKDSANSIYDPFLKDASNLFNISGHFRESRIYGKEANNLYYFYSLIKAFIHECDFSNVFLKCEDATESMAYDEELFDVIVSKVPNRSRFFQNIIKARTLKLQTPTKSTLKSS